MSRRQLVALVGVLGLLFVGLPAAFFLFAYGCGGQEDRLAEVMAHEAVLDVETPEGAGQEERSQSCDEDDLFVVVGARYPYGGSPENYLGRYREAALADGWRTRGAAGGATVPECFVKSVGGTTAYFSVERLDDGFVYAEIVASADGSEHC